MQICLIIHSRVLPMDRYCFASLHDTIMWVCECQFVCPKIVMTGTSSRPVVNQLGLLKVTSVTYTVSKNKSDHYN